MKKQEITIVGKPVTLGYCYATEIAYKELAGEEIQDFMPEVYSSLSSQTPRMPDIKKSIYLILSAVTAYYESVKQAAPVTDSDLLNEVSPAEIGTALGTVLKLRADFYNVPKDEPKDKTDEKGTAEKKD